MVGLYWNAVYRLLFHLSGSTHDAEDLAQETFLRALGRRESFHSGTNMRAWLLRIATNAFFDLRRKHKTARAAPLQEDLLAERAPQAAPMEQAETGRMLAAAIARLPETPRAVFLLRSQEELSFAEIADVLGLSQGTARWHMLQARRQLMGELDGKL